MPWVQIKPGCTHGADRRYRAGDVLEVTAEAARDFADKFSEVPAPVVTGEDTALVGVTAETVATSASVASQTAPAKRRGRRARSSDQPVTPA
jgi:hypothetical protein